MARNIAKAPSGLGPAGRAYYEAIVKEIDLAPERARLLRDAAQTIDTIERLQEAIAEAPLIMKGGAGGQIANPLIVEVRQQRALLSRLTAALMIPEAPDASGVPSRSEQAKRAALVRWGKAV